MGNCFASIVNERSNITPKNITRPATPVTSSMPVRTSCSSSAPTEKLSTSKESTSSNDLNYEVDNGQILEKSNVKSFTFDDLKIATKNFRSDTVLGEGGFGMVYKGWVDEKTLNPMANGLGMIIAIKKLKHQSLQGFQEWQSEVKFLGKLSHPNLVRLFGFCSDGKDLLLVYEFMPKGSLEKHLFRMGADFRPLSWDLRIRIAIGAAKGLAFLHSSDEKIIYRDFKASNILLDSNFNPKLSDFGLAKNGPTDGNTHVSTRVMGTFGYAAPEYIKTGRLYVQSDVYGFGVVLLELLSGMRALDHNRPRGQQNLVQFARPYLSEHRKLHRIMDPQFMGQYPLGAAFRVAQLAVKCVSDDPKSRPSMREVLETLLQIDTVKSRLREPKPESPQLIAPGHSPGPIYQLPPIHPRHGSRLAFQSHNSRVR